MRSFCGSNVGGWIANAARSTASAAADASVISTGRVAAPANLRALRQVILAREPPLTLASPIARVGGMEHIGGCHCGNIHVRLRLSQPPEDNPLRACTCSFCRSHRPRIVADREGLFEVRADDWSLVENYQFGTRTCDFLICRRCGVFIAAVTETAEGTRAVVNANCLDDRERFTAAPVLHNFDGETSETRSARHAANWMPAVIRRQ